MLKEHYIDKMRVAVFGKVKFSCDPYPLLWCADVFKHLFLILRVPVVVVLFFETNCLLLGDSKDGSFDFVSPFINVSFEIILKGKNIHYV